MSYFPYLKIVNSKIIGFFFLAIDRFYQTKLWLDFMDTKSSLTLAFIIIHPDVFFDPKKDVWLHH